jgi:chemotaxis protein histidine kinase CheA
MDSESGGGKTTLYIVVFFLCVISMLSGYFYYAMGSSEAEAQKKLADTQAKAEADMAAAKSEEEKREIQRKADLGLERAKAKVQVDAEKKALAGREAKIKAAEAAVNKKLADAAATVKNAQNLQKQANVVKAGADKKNKDAAAAMAKAVASGKAVDKKLADEKKKLAADAKKKVDAANKAAAAAKAQATAEANKALSLKKQYDQLNKRANMFVGAIVRLNAVPGYYKDGKTIAWGGEGPKTGDTQVCREWAAKLGYPAWGHRTADHPDPNWKNSCFGYKEVRARHDVKRDGDEAHIVGCTFTDLRPDQTVCSLPKNFYRYVKIHRQKMYADHWLNLAGVDIISDGRNIASEAQITSSSIAASAPAKNLVDGNMNTIAHTMNGLGEWFLFDFGKRVSIDKVVIWNRRDCCQARARDIQVMLSNDNRNWINGPKIRPDRAGFWRHQWIVGEDSFLSD